MPMPTKTVAIASFLTCAVAHVLAWGSIDFPGDVRKSKQPLLAKQPAIPIEGAYRVTGEDSEGNKYSGTVSITKFRDSAVWGVYYTLGHGMGKGMVQYQGIGILNGSNFSVSWEFMSTSGKVRGVTSYVVGEGAWVGVWGTSPIDSGTETLTRIKE